MAQYVHSFHPSTPSADASEAKRELGCESRAGCFHASMLPCARLGARFNMYVNIGACLNLVTVGKSDHIFMKGKLVQLHYPL